MHKGGRRQSFDVSDWEGFDYCYPRWCVATAQPFEHVLSPHTTKQCSLVIPTYGEAHIFSSHFLVSGATFRAVGAARRALTGLTRALFLAGRCSRACEHPSRIPDKTIGMPILITP